MLDLYRNIKALRTEKRMTQAELAEKVGYSDKGMISKIENGLVDLPISKIEEFAEIFSVSPCYLMGWEESPSPSSANLTDEAVTIAKAYMRADDGTKSSVAKLLDVKREDSIEMEERKSA